jgi:hypothetical protein
MRGYGGVNISCSNNHWLLENPVWAGPLVVKNGSLQPVIDPAGAVLVDEG